jgi:GH25 family lysozyme M1 (1,4-beta-N-acetylmuramidase)
MRARGVDLSRCQGGHIDFRTLAASVDFVLAKGTEGATGIDPTCVHNVTEARKAGLLVAGVYHVLTTQSPVMGQVSNALRLQAQHGAPIVLDFEVPRPEQWAPPWTGGALLGRAVNFCDCVEESEQACVVYSDPWFLQHLPYGDNLLQLVDRPLWIARYGDQKHWPGEDAQPALVNPWTEWLFWQFSGDGGLPAPGIPSVVDHDVFNGTRADLAKWLGTPA